MYIYLMTEKKETVVQNKENCSKYIHMFSFCFGNISYTNFTR
jgi:hypothetical protein